MRSTCPPPFFLWLVSPPNVHKVYQYILWIHLNSRDSIFVDFVAHVQKLLVQLQSILYKRINKHSLKFVHFSSQQPHPKEPFKKLKSTKKNCPYEFKRFDKYLKFIKNSPSVFYDTFSKCMYCLLYVCNFVELYISYFRLSNWTNSINPIKSCNYTFRVQTKAK